MGDIMNKIKTSFKKYQNLLKYLGLLSLLGFLIGFLIYKKIDNHLLIAEIKNIANYLSTNHLNYILTHFIAISILLTCSLTVIGLILFPLYFLIECISLSYNIFIFTEIYHFKGLIFSILYIIITKIIFIILLLCIFQKLIKTIKNIIKIYTNKEDINHKYSLLKNIKAVIIYLLFIFLNDILIYIIGSKILLKLTFIIK